MDLKPYTVNISRGDGLIARFGDIVMYIADPTASADRLLAAIEAAADAERPGAAVAERLATLAFGKDAAESSPFGVVAPTPEGLLLILRGAVAAEIRSGDDTRSLAGVRALTWVDEILPWSVQGVAIATRSESPAPDCPHTDLRAGVVPGGGFSLHRVSSAEDRSDEPVPVAAAAPQPMGSTDDRSDGAVPDEGAVRPRAGSADQLDEATAHPTDRVDTRDDPTLGASLSETSGPIAGELALDNGSVFQLDRCYVIGRDPLTDVMVRNETASPIVLHDRYVSRVHAYISIDMGTVFVRDALTPGGTFIASPGTDNWTRIGTGPTELPPGWRLRIGGRTMTYRT